MNRLMENDSANQPLQREAEEIPLLGPIALSSCASKISDQHQRLIGLFLIVGILLRCSRYFLHFPLWEDECFLVSNFIDRGYFELLEPLSYHQIAPVLFLWIELTLVKLCGFHEFSLRFFPFVCSLVGLLLFTHLAKRLLTGSALVIAVGVFAVSYPNMRYAAEAKQYASDMLVGLIFLSLCVQWWRLYSEQDARAVNWLWGITIWTPFAIGLSYPAVFSAGAVSLLIGSVLLSEVWNQRTQFPKLFTNPSVRIWGLYNCVLLGTFVLILTVVVPEHSAAEREWMGIYWANAFPPLTSMSDLFWWLITTHCGSLLAFPLGGNSFASTATTLCVVIGVVFLVRRERRLALLLLTPAALHLLAAVLQRYPYGEHFKFSMHMSGSICLVAGLGTASLLLAIERQFFQRKLMLRLVTVYFLLIASVSMIRDFRSPHKTESDMRARAFARWYWFQSSLTGEVACLENDLGLVMTPDARHELNWGVMYLVNKEIYAPPTVGRPDFSRVSNDHPLRFTLYRVPKFEFDADRFDRWMEKMQLQYELVSTEEFLFPRYSKHQDSHQLKDASTIDTLEIYEFVPRPSSMDSPLRLVAPQDETSLR